ncbi:MAG: 3-hydroxyacyl-CoA dehydrogenase family protein [Bacillota bacterium]
MKVAVIGAGVMGPGIAQSWLLAGHEAALIDINEEALLKGKEKIKDSINMMLEKGLVEKSAEAYLTNFTTTISLAEGVEGAVLVIEAVAENPDIKSKIYEELDKLCPADTVIVSNTSSLPLPQIFPNFRPKKFFICHYFNPPEIIPLVELVKGEKTDEGAVLWLKEKLEECGKKPIILNGYKTGFLVNRLQIAMMREALEMVGSGIVKPEDVDTAVTCAIGFKHAWQGLFDTMDYIGLDTVAMAYVFVSQDLHSGTDVPEVIVQKIEEGALGVKSGRGFFDYSGDEGMKALKRRSSMLFDQYSLWKKGAI